MKITKYEHACFVAEENGQSLVVDPGVFTTDFVMPENVVAIFVTHEHSDHMDKDLLHSIVDKNPGVLVVSHPDITPHLEGFDTRPVNAGDKLAIGDFELEFFGGQHATIVNDSRPLANLGVMINNRIYYPGDSFAVPEGKSVEMLALPAAAPWMKISEAVSFLQAVKPQFAFPTHDAILSDAGKSIVDNWLSRTAEKTGAQYQRLSSSIPKEI